MFDERLKRRQHLHIETPEGWIGFAVPGSGSSQNVGHVQFEGGEVAERSLK
jgi:hypothetical protein